MNATAEKNSFAILGFPLYHTLSPQIHSRLFALDKTKAEYSVFEIPSDNLSAAMPRLEALSGFNVTIPHKLAIMPFLDKLDASAMRYGAVNCVKNVNGKLHGFNTDCYGFTRSLSAAGASLSGHVLLLGCGGAGRMMAAEAALAGARLTIAARDMEAAGLAARDIQRLLPEFTAEIVPFTKISGTFDLLINSTPVGMFPNADDCPVPNEIIADCAAVFDAVYNPRHTLLLKRAEALQKKTVGGMGMLVWQAAAAHEIWGGNTYSDSDINALIAEMEGLV